jgi:catechol 2,3-dioxygenase-like lactoylglutathione lyase family enzyme
MQVMYNSSGHGELNTESPMAPTISGIAPFFIVANVPTTLAFYRDMLGFEITFRGPSPEDEFFGIVRRDGATIMFKALGEICDGKEVLVDPVPNYGRKPAFSWDVYIDVPDPDALAAEFAARGVVFAAPLRDRGDDGVRGFVVRDVDGYGLFFGNHRA